MRLFGSKAKAGIQHAALTDVGRRRDKNEDAFAVIAPPADAAWGFDLALVVCDGVGGQPSGEMASQLAVSAFRDILSRADDHPIPERIATAAAAATAAITDYATREVGGAPLATTLAMVVVRNGQVTTAHIGDSRVYRLRKGQFETLTADHSIVAEQVRAGLIPASEARTHPLRSRLSRALGIGHTIGPDVGEQPAERGDTYLVCSDGLHAFVEEREIVRAIGDDLERSARKLIELANAAGGVDNITVALCRI